MRNRIASISLVFSLILPAMVLAQGTLEDYKRAERFLPWNVTKLVQEADVKPQWIEKSDRFWYRSVTQKGKQFLVVDAAKKTREPLFDHAKLAAAFSRVADREYHADKLPFDVFAYDPKAPDIKFTHAGVQWRCTLDTYNCLKLKDRPRQRGDGFSPDGRWQAFVRDHNLWVRSVSNNQEIRLTDDGVESYDYATPLPSGGELIQRAATGAKPNVAVFWAPDSSKFVTYRMDSRFALRMTTIQSVPPDRLRPIAYTYAYPLPGEALSRAEPIIFDVERGQRIAVQADPISMAFQGGPGFEWDKESRHFYFNTSERGWKRNVLHETDSSTGKTRTVLEEASDTFVDPATNFIESVNDASEFLMGSERDGWNHLYLFDGKTGELKKQLTKGEWVVRQIVQINEKARQVYFLASGREAGEDPYLTHLYCVNLDGTGLKMLTPEAANHAAIVSPSNSYFIDTYSRPDLPTKVVLRRTSDGGVVMPLEETNAKELLKTGWKYPEAFHGKGRDGKVDIYGLIWRPSNFDPSRKYPVIEQIYTGPQSFFVPKTFAAFRSTAQSTAELGFIVVMIDGQGTGGRSKAFHNFSYRNLGDGGIDDHISVLKQMAEKYPYMDLGRVGLYGGSAGGYDTAHAMLTHPKFYKVGVSTSANHDHRMDKAWWNELWMGYPLGDHYREQSNVTMAGKLEGKLFLVHGDLDDNVSPSATLQFADALIKANKNFDMLIVPNQYHGEGRNPYVIRRRWDYFVQNLAGVAPPSGFEIQQEDNDRRGN
ncbi:MAG TPA: DPP IV N-terminal domain-containing protein [Clostridia bacterium]|nr:DPP IV N-terminal domain-containing protein [Clostridia bacterium]